MRVQPLSARNRRRRPLTQFWFLQTLGWLGYATALTLPWIGRYTLASIIPNKLFIAFTGFALTAALRALYHREALRSRGLGVVLTAALLSSAAAGVVWNALVGEVVGVHSALDMPSLGAMVGGVPRINGMLYDIGIMLGWSFTYLGLRYHNDLLSAHARAAEAEAHAKGARLEALTYQLNPHFLFNALNGISTLIIQERRSEAVNAIASLADVLRKSLESSSSTSTSLHEELALIERYLNVERMRFGERLNSVIDVADETKAMRVPPMLLFPIVENAVRHAVAPRDSTTTVRIHSHMEDDVLHIDVADIGDPHEPIPSTAGFGVGLSNTRERLRVQYGADAQLFVLTSDRGTTVQIAVPQALPVAAHV